MNCQCHQPGLGFTIDWGGIISNTVKAVGAVSVARNTLRLQQAQQAAALRAQEAEFQLQQRRQAQTVAPPASGYVAAPTGQIVQVAPSGALVPVYQRPSSQVPPWAIPAAIGVGVLFLMRK